MSTFGGKLHLWGQKWLKRVSGVPKHAHMSARVDWMGQTAPAKAHGAEKAKIHRILGEGARNGQI